MTGCNSDDSDSDFGIIDQYEWKNHAATDRVDEGVAGSDTEEEDEEEMAMEASLAEAECRLEPPRPPINQRLNPNHGDDLPQATQQGFRLRGNYEQPLTKEPFVVTFPRIAPSQPGPSHTANDDTDVNAATGPFTDQHQSLADGTNNIFAPFLSKMEWEVARWAKLRGPGSTSFSELMSIEGVSRALKGSWHGDSL